MAKYVFGVDIGGTTVKMGLFDGEGTLLEKWEITTTAVEGDNTAILKDVTAAIKAKQAERGIADGEVLGVGMGVPGPVLVDGTVNRCVNLKWGVFNVEETMSALCGYPVKAGNDANVATLGEQFKGGGAGYADVVMITLGTGVGAGVVVGNKMIPGAFGAAGEVGHMHMVDGETEVCGCGNTGCLEQYASATGVVRLCKRYLAAHPETETPLGKELEISSLNVFNQAKAGDAVAEAVVNEYFDILGRALALIACVVDPQVFVLGGGVSNAGQYLIDGATEAYKKYCFHASRNVKIMKAQLGNDAGIYGACGMILGA